MSSKKTLSLLLLFAIIFSVMHDYTFIVLEDDHHSVKEYIDTLEAYNSDSIEDIHDIHSQYHTSIICLIELLPADKIEKTDSIFINNDIFISWNNFYFFKPPIA